MLIARLAEGQTQFKQRAIPISLITIVIACQSPTYRGEGTDFLTELIVGIKAGL